MILSIHRDSSTCTHEAARLLPWLVTGTLSEPDASRVEQHMRECAICTADFKREERLQDLMSQEPVVEQAPQPGLQDLMTRIDEVERELPLPAAGELRAPARRRFGALQWLAAAAIVQAVGLGVLGMMLWQRGAELRAPRFHTLSDSAPGVYGPGRIRVVFAPRLTVSDMQALLKSIPASVVAGPTDAGVYTIAMPEQRTEVGPVLSQLRANSGVLFAEPQAQAGRVE